MQSKVKQGKIPAFKERFQNIVEKYGGQTEFANKSGISRQTVGFWYNGDRVPNAEMLIEISKFCGVSCDYLLGMTDCACNDTSLRAACDYTGLSENAINALRGKRDRGNINCDIMNFLIENEETFELFERTQEYLKFNPVDKYCVFDDKGNISDCQKSASATIKEMAIKRTEGGEVDYLFVRAVQTEKLLNRLILSDIESGLSRARGEYQKEHLPFSGEKKEG